MIFAHVHRDAWLLALVATVGAAAPSFAQDSQPTPVTKGATIARRLPPGAMHDFMLRVRAPSFVVGTVDQHDVDLVVTATDSAGRVLARVDGPPRGPERFAFAAERPGSYRIRVSAFVSDSGGAYTLRIPRVDRLATTPEARVDQVMALGDPDGPGAAVGVMRGGRLVFAKGYGRASLEFPAPITPNTPFHVGSVSKQFTAMGIVLLAQQGRLSLDDDVRKHVPELPALGATITLRHLLNHTSGIRDQWDLWAMAGGRMDDVIRQEDLFRLVTRQQQLNFTPGTEYVYSNSGYMLLAKVVERAGGKPFAAWMSENLFAPLGMRDTHVHDDHERVVPGRAYSYENADAGGYRNAVLSYANAGPTSVFTTVADLARWLDNFRTGVVGGADARAQLTTRAILASGDTLPYALGLVVDRFRGQPRFQHGGSDRGFRAFVAYYPQLESGVVVLSNHGSFDPARTAARVAEAWFGDKLAAPGGAPGPMVATPAAPSGVAIDPARLDALTGRFVGAAGFPFTITRDGGQLFVRAGDQPPLPARALSDSTFRLDAVGATLSFVRLPSGAVDSVRLNQGGTIETLQRDRPWSPSAADYAELAGRYYSPELDVSYELVASGTRLLVRRANWTDMPLTVRGRDAFGGRWPLVTLRVERDSATGQVRGLRVSTERTRDVRFVRQEPGSPRDLR